MIDAEPTKRMPRFIPAVIRWRVGVLALWVAVIATSGVAYLSHFRIDNSVAIWFLEDDPELDTYRNHNSEFGEREWTYVWLRGDPVFAPEFLRDLQLLGKRIQSLENVTQVVSLTELDGIEAGPDGLPVFASAAMGSKGLVPGSGRLPRFRRAELVCSPTPMAWFRSRSTGVRQPLNLVYTRATVLH